MNAQINLDANETAYFKRHLEHVLPTVQDVVYAGLTALQTFPVIAGVDQTAETVTYYQYDKRLLAKIVSEYSNDAPTVEVNGKAFTSVVKPVGAKRVYSINELRRASLVSGVDILARKADATREAIAQLHNRLFWVGDTITGVVGVLSNASIPNAQVTADGTGSSSLWSTKTGDKILRDLNNAVTDIINATNGVENAPNLLVISPQRYRVMQTAKIDTDNSRTVLDQFQIDNPTITEIVQASELVGAFQGGSEGFLIGRSNPSHIGLVAPIVYEEYAPKQDGSVFEVTAGGRNGGAIIFYPLAFTKKYGI
jgi:hypothetical protein